MTELITTTFNRDSTALEVVEGINLTGKTAIVTGASSGIGIETARALASAGASVTLAVRDVNAGTHVATQIIQTTGNSAVTIEHLDLVDIASVDSFVDRWQGPLDILVNNAGVMTTPETYTDNGWELQFAVNHLGHFALATGLHGALSLASSARVVSVSSSGHGSSDINFEDPFFENRPYDAGTAYGQSKTAQVLFCVEATRRWASDGITSNALMPGGIWTNLQRHWDPDVLSDTKTQMAAQENGIMKTPEQGAATTIFVATSPILDGIGGRYFDDCNEAETVGEIIDGLHGVRAYALDPDAAERLWDLSTKLINSARHSANG